MMLPWLQKRGRLFRDRDVIKLHSACPDEMGAMAPRGPRVVEFIDPVISGTSIGNTGLITQVSELKKNEMHPGRFSGTARLGFAAGYTGEDGS